ncbi:MAG: protein kinase [Kofleriaceae bacterium]
MTCTYCHAALAAGARFCGGCGRASAGTAELAPKAEPPSLEGREIAGRYRIKTKLGEGGMGAVYKAEQISLKREVALKVLKPDLVSSPTLLRRFNAEAEAVAKLNHPNTVSIYDFGQDADGTLFIAMEFVEGASLRAALIAESPFPPARALHIAGQIAASLGDAHAAGIIHRDLKPDNIMLQRRGKSQDVVRVLDFGIAKLRDDSRGTQHSMTQAGDVLGTPQYMSPEQIRGEEIDGRADVYALGAILYEMLTGRMVFEAGSLVAMLSRHLMDQPEAPSSRRPDLGLTRELDELVLACLAKDLRVRVPSMDRAAELVALAAQGAGAAPADARYSGGAAAYPGGPGLGSPLTPAPITGAPPGPPGGTAAPATTPAQLASLGPMTPAGGPGYPSPASYPGYAPASQPGYPPAASQPGHPPASPPGYPQAASQPGYPQAASPPGYPQAASQPGYPQAASPPGYAPPPGSPYPPEAPGAVQAYASSYDDAPVARRSSATIAVLIVLAVLAVGGGVAYLLLTRSSSPPRELTPDASTDPWDRKDPWEPTRDPGPSPSPSHDDHHDHSHPSSDDDDDGDYDDPSMAPVAPAARPRSLVMSPRKIGNVGGVLYKAPGAFNFLVPPEFSAEPLITKAPEATLWTFAASPELTLTVLASSAPSTIDPQDPEPSIRAFGAALGVQLRSWRWREIQGARTVSAIFLGNSSGRDVLTEAVLYVKARGYLVVLFAIDGAMFDDSEPYRESVFTQRISW